MQSMQQNRNLFPPAPIVSVPAQTAVSTSDVCSSRLLDSLLSPKTFENRSRDKFNSVDKTLKENLNGQTEGPVFKFLQKKKGKEENFSIKVPHRIKKKVIIKRFSSRFTKESKVLNKVRRTRVYWEKQS